MEFARKVAVVTGGANGIGAALCRGLARRGAAVVVADLDLERAGSVAREVNGLALRCDVGSEEEVLRLVAEAEAKAGPIDLFCSNAGITSLGGIEVPTPVWNRMWAVNVMAHLYAARALVPRMIERGGGYLANTASSAGLLNQVDATCYAVTKHAAVGLAESLAIAYGDRGVKVSVICPGAVRTDMTRESAGGAEADGMLEPEQAAEIILDGIAKEEFLILTHPVVRTYVQRKASDYDRWIKGMQRMRDRLSDTSPGLRGSR